jgi:mono/diheme cytochrome c family protein
MSAEIRKASSVLPLLATLTFAGPSSAQAVADASGAAPVAPTFYADALPVFYKNCVACHQPDGPNVGGIKAPMSLTTYDEAHRWAARIKRAVETGYMPPWGAPVEFKGQFEGERYLSPEDKATILAWVDAGAPAGNPTAAPSESELSAMADMGSTKLPASGWWIGDPDLVVGFKEPVHVPDSVVDWQPTFQMMIPPGAHTEPKWVSQAELRPGGPWVHHIVSSHMGVGVPGRGPFTYPKGWGVLLPENPYITVNMHYHKKAGPGTGVEDNTQAAFKFYKPGDVIDYVVQTDLNFTRDWVIPAGDPNYAVTHVRSFDQDTYLLSMGPHMHLRGKAMKYELEYPDGSMKTLLYVPHYDFNWQFLYQYKEPFFIPAGSKLHMTWWFDNSADNPNNPDPTVDVRYGPSTTDEMANARIYFAPTTPRHIVVGGPIPPDVLKQANEEEARRRAQAEAEGT